MDHENLVCPSYISIIRRLRYFSLTVHKDSFACDLVCLIKSTFDPSKSTYHGICLTAIFILKPVLIGKSNKVYFCFIDAQINGLYDLLQWNWLNHIHTYKCIVVNPFCRFLFFFLQ